MNYTLLVEPEAEAEIEEAVRWYEVSSTQLANNFLLAVEAALATISSNPLQYQIVHGRMRRSGIRHFPYGLIYVSLEREVIVLGCIHGRRDPKSWQDRSR
jgi:plasmid stabilization system protein ParE